MIAPVGRFLRNELAYFLGAVRFFTRLPVPGWVGHSSAALNSAARYFPAVGLLVGGLSATTFWLASQCWPPLVALWLAMLASLLITGAFHEDGLADMIDGFGGGWEKTRILDIMKDSRVGSFGVIALIAALGGKFLLLAQLPVALIPLALVAGHTVSRFASTALIATLDYVREDATSKSKPLATRLGGLPLLVAALFALLPLPWLPVAPVCIGLALVALATLWMGRWMRRWIGGYTGDCLGATQQVSELAFYLGLGAQLPSWF